jgi:hypothetical protein
MTATPRDLERPLVSVVTPVYNGEPYLAQCIESVLAQTYDRWDYTIVNNCSTDGSLEIAQDYARRDPRIRVEQNPTFLGQVANLNRALSCASPGSKYIKMVLADDWMFPECLQAMVGVAERNPSTGLITAYRLDERRVNCDGLPYPGELVSGREVCRATLLSQLYVFGSPNTVMFRADLVRGRMPFYNEASLHEDTEACYEILMEHDLGFVHQVLTFTRRQNESLTAARKIHDPEHLLDRLITTLKYAPRFLEPGEGAACRRAVETEYYRFLARRVLRGADPAFWEYHRSALRPTGYHIRRGTLARHMALAVLRRLSAPWPTRKDPR